ncbi:hypothetical protein LQG66_27240 [Bradyrhizobium ontarionense]|uniref:Fibronectin type-III domain-containing protein n=1 Tax=Bradyrhizobium ontarionense TaxID=2898149 RepID=A0ABY3R7N3_9BRAD|nr:hypothetical protein [Bradyrhizobium sp. A19]UFZ02925.1 hypothetical protein LQG66_27240 [Bradyrhizobium sp. A19]
MVDTIGFVILDAVGITAVTATTASIIGTAVILATTVGLQYLLGQPSARDLPKASNGHQPLRQPIPPHIYAYGRVRLAGYYALFEVRNGAAFTIQALHKGQICRFLKVYLHDDEANVLPDSSVTGAVGTSDFRYSAGADPSSGGHPPIVIEYRIGHATETGYDRPVQAMPDIWTYSHRGDGIASLFMSAGPVRAENFSAVYPQGLPQPSALADWLPVWDPRVPGQDPDNIATLGPSYNPVLQAIDFVTNAAHGLGFDRAACIAPVLDALMTEASICDELVGRRDGATEPRYQASGSWNSETEPAAVLDGIMAACDGWYTFNGDGTLSIKVGKYREPRVTLPQRHILALSVDNGIEDESSVNTLEWNFTDPDNKYKSSPGLAWRDETAIFESGRSRSQTIDLTWVQSHAQGRRLMKRKIAQINPRRKGTITTTLYGIAALGERWVRIQDDRHPDLADTIVQIGKAVIDISAARLTFEWITVNTNEIDAWDPGTEEGMQPTTGDDNPGDTLPVPQHLAGTAAGGTITLTFDDPARADVTYVVQFRIGAGAWVQTPSGSASSNGTTVTLVVSGFSTGHTYELQVATQRSLGVLSAWSSSVIVAV